MALTHSGRPEINRIIFRRTGTESALCNRASSSSFISICELTYNSLSIDCCQQPCSFPLVADRVPVGFSLVGDPDQRRSSNSNRRKAGFARCEVSSHLRSDLEKTAQLTRWREPFRRTLQDLESKRHARFLLQNAPNKPKFLFSKIHTARQRRWHAFCSTHGDGS